MVASSTVVPPPPLLLLPAVRRPALLALAALPATVSALANGVAALPPLGWSSWNSLAGNYNVRVPAIRCCL